MKLYIWIEPYNVAYGQSWYMAVAESADNARAIARNAPRNTFLTHDDRLPPMRDSADDLLAGPPTRVVDIPCGEWHEWSE